MVEIEELDKHAFGMGLGCVLLVFGAFGSLALIALFPEKNMWIAPYSILIVPIIIVGYFAGYIMAGVYNNICKYKKKR